MTQSVIHKKNAMLLNKMIGNRFQKLRIEFYLNILTFYYSNYSNKPIPRKYNSIIKLSFILYTFMDIKCVDLRR